jgi:ATP-dependent protease HslVU (ClpYQ) peptidase subunit
VTCIVAVETPDGVIMGADSAGSDGHTTATVEAPKVFANGPLLIGYTSSFRMGQLLQYALEVPEESLGWDVDAWVAVELVPAIRKAFEGHGWDRVNEGRAKGGNFLVAVSGRCYEMQSDYSFLRNTAGEYAVGSGYAHALGCLYATRQRLVPEDRVVRALQAAAEHVVSVDGPFHLYEQETPNE